MTAGEQAGALAVRDLPDSMGVRIDAEVGSGPASMRSTTWPTDSWRGDRYGGWLGGGCLLPLRGLPDSDSISIDYDLGGVAGLLPLRDLPKATGSVLTTSWRGCRSVAAARLAR